VADTKTQKTWVNLGRGSVPTPPLLPSSRASGDIKALLHEYEGHVTDLRTEKDLLAQHRADRKRILKAWEEAAIEARRAGEPPPVNPVAELDADQSAMEDKIATIGGAINQLLNEIATEVGDAAPGLVDAARERRSEAEARIAELAGALLAQIEAVEQERGVEEWLARAATAYSPPLFSVAQFTEARRGLTLIGRDFPNG
jgi:hypothetical protein